MEISQRRAAPPQGLLVDLDDTIVADGTLTREAWDDALRGVESEGLSVPALRAAIDAESRWYWSDPDRHRVGRLDLTAARATIAGAALNRLGHHRPELAAVIAMRYEELKKARVHLLPGSLEALTAFRTAGIKLALVTNGAAAPQRAKIQRFGLDPYFDAILVEGERPAGKPDPTVYADALHLLSLKATDAWMVGDNLEWDVNAPQQCGIRGVWVDVWGTGLREGSSVTPFRIVRSLSELADLILASAG
jgi:putative hydrolase of the HAD superfamily